MQLTLESGKHPRSTSRSPSPYLLADFRETAALVEESVPATFVSVFLRKM